MAKLRLAERSTDETDPSTQPSSTLAPDPAGITSSAKAALRRCTKAWDRQYKANVEREEEIEFDEQRYKVLLGAAQAYCEEMPLLVGEDGIRNFLVCAAHGIVSGLISPKKATPLIYAAQVAINLLQHQTRQQNLTQTPPFRRALKQLPPPPSLTTAQKTMQENEQTLLNKYFEISS